MPDNQDLIAGIDPTSLNNMSAAQLLQMINDATVNADRGFVVTTWDDNAGNPDVPNGTGTTKFQRYIWRRVGATATTYYGWTPSAANNVSGPGMLKWVPITISAIPDNAVTNSKIANLAVTDGKIYSVDFAKVTGVPGFVLGTDLYAAGDFIGSAYNNPVIKANAVTEGKLASDALLNANRAVSVLHIKNGTALYSLRTNAAGNAVEWYLDYFAQLISQSGLGTAFQAARVKSDATGLTWVNPTILQTIRKEVTSSDNIGGIQIVGLLSANANSGTVLTNANGATDTGFDVTITPKSATSKLRIKVSLQAALSAAGTLAAWLCDGATVIGGGLQYYDAADITRRIDFEFLYTPVAGGQRTFNLRLAANTAATAYINRTTTFGKFFNNTPFVVSYIQIEEMFDAIPNSN